MALSVWNGPTPNITSVGNASPGRISSVANYDGSQYVDLTGGQTLGASTGGSTGGGGSTYSSGGGGGYTAPAPAPPKPTPEQIAASEAEFAVANQRAGEIGALKSEILARRQRANSIFDSLTAAVNSLTKEKRAALETQFADEQTRATENFTREGDQLQRTYAGRGLGDSSYKTEALDTAGKGYERAIKDLGTARQTGLAKVGSEAATNLAGINADRSSVNAANLDEILNSVRVTGVDNLGLKSYNLGELTDNVSTLRDLRNQIDDRIRKAEVQQAGFNTEQGFRGKLNQIAPYNGINQNLQSALSALVNSAAPKVVKDRLATAIINNYDPSNGQQWQNFYDTESEKLNTATSTE